MFCTQCGKQIKADSLFCPFCGKAIKQGSQPVPPKTDTAAQEAQPEPPKTDTAAQEAQSLQPEPGAGVQEKSDSDNTGNIATLKGLKCPHCGSENWRVTGTKGALGASLATGLAFGAIGNIVAGSSAKKNLVTRPLQYKCAECRKKFESMPLIAASEDIIEVPCTITFIRERSFVGSAVPQIVHLNGVKIAPVKNGRGIEFATSSRYNVIFVTDQYGVAFQGDYRFEAAPGGSVNVRFNRKFL